MSAHAEAAIAATQAAMERAVAAEHAAFAAWEVAMTESREARARWFAAVRSYGTQALAVVS